MHLEAKAVTCRSEIGTGHAPGMAGHQRKVKVTGTKCGDSR